MGNPLTHDEARRVIENARRLGVPEKEFDFNPKGLAGQELRNPQPHFKIGGSHIYVEPGFQPPPRIP